MVVGTTDGEAKLRPALLFQGIINLSVNHQESLNKSLGAKKTKNLIKLASIAAGQMS